MTEKQIQEIMALVAGLSENERLIGRSEAKREYGDFTEQDARFVFAMNKSCAQKRAAIESALREQVPEGWKLVPVAYLDIGAGGYVDLGSELSADALAELPKGRHMLAIIGTYGVDGYMAAPQPAQAERCKYCDDTGDVHSIDGQWRGRCTCKAAQAEQPVKLEDIEQYRLQMAGISTAAIGYWKEGDGIHPDYDTVALRDVARLYAKYDELYRAQAEQPKAVQAPFGRVTIRRARHPNHTDMFTFYPWPQPPYLDNVDECVTLYTKG
jgi:hypothetical protein